mgnify:CR=1 FL=1
MTTNISYCRQSLGTRPIVLLSRRATVGGMLAMTVPFGWAQNAPQTLATHAQAWRALSRVGYGPTPNLAQSVSSMPNARDWAMQQIDLAFADSSRSPVIGTDLWGLQLDLPQIFERFRAEREARKTKKNTPQTDAPEPMELGSTDPLHFSRTMAQQAAAWHLRACSQPEQENPLLARMTEFWFNHLNVFSGKGAVRPFVGHYLTQVIRRHALGRFEDLVLASARHPAMLAYLDQAQSVADGTRSREGKARGLNENYARELMELHTLGVNGGYTQGDVRELARVLTGWTVAPREADGFRFAPRLHDHGTKQVLGRTFHDAGEQEGVAAIRMLARHPSTARRIGLRLAKFFISDNPPSVAVDAIARSFLDTQGDMRAVLRTVFASDAFWATDQTLFKTPMDFVCSALAATQSASDTRHLVLSAGFLKNAGQPIHGWQTPDGYAFDAATWMVPEALTRRADYALAVARQADTSFLLPFLSAATRQTLEQERPALRAGLILASPDFMAK